MEFKQCTSMDSAVPAVLLPTNAELTDEYKL